MEKIKILSTIDRISKSRNIGILKTSQKTWEIHSENSGKQYQVKFENGKFSCTCPDHVYRNVNCKHIIKVSGGLNGVKISSEQLTFF